MTITEFLLARIAGNILQGDPGFSTVSGLTQLRRWNIGRHITRHDPARTLAECAAKRATRRGACDFPPRGRCMLSA